MARRNRILLGAAYVTLFALGAAGTLAFMPMMSASGEQRSGPPSGYIRVIDGDTLEDMSADITYRLVNIDTPETGNRASCPAERAQGEAATQAVRDLIATAQSFEARPTGRSDYYGRTIAYVLVDGRDLGETLMEEELARPWRGRRYPWCDAYGQLLP
jgi:endonuclease YncB( thermonuclease family)